MFVAVMIVAVFSGFQHGYNTGIFNHIAGTSKEWTDSIIQQNYNTTLISNEITNIYAVITSIYCFGGIFGGLLSGILSTKLGSRKALMLNCVIVAVGAFFELLCQFDKTGDVVLMIIGRFIIGVNSGINAGIAPVYCCDVSPLDLRGTMGSMYQLWITISILIAFTIGMVEIAGMRAAWCYAMSIPVILMTVIQFILLWMVSPESPKYLLISKEDIDLATLTLQKLRKPEADVTAEIAEMKSEHDKIQSMAKIKLKDFIKKPLSRPLIIVIVMMLAQQLSGINAVIFYSGQIYTEIAKMTNFEAEMANIGFAVINVLVTVVSVYFVDKIGRKALLTFAFGGMAVITFLLMLCLILVDKADFIKYLSIACVYVYIILFASGAGSIPWFLVSEMFEQNAKPTAQAIGVAVNWIANFIVCWTFPPIQVKISAV